MIWQISREQREGSQGIIMPCFHHATSGSPPPHFMEIRLSHCVNKNDGTVLDVTEIAGKNMTTHHS
jgi:hypothetical protein